MCRVCLKRPEIPEERYGRCEACAKAGRVPVRLQIRTLPEPWRVRAGELSPRALRERAGAGLAAFSGQPSPKGHLVHNQCELILVGSRVEQIRAAPGLARFPEQLLAALREAAGRSDASW
ncbi:MAG TPA: hypothetical protein VMW47_00015 [Verrucomicrobiae bacterium]|nr:hypothetical protein [Verrucomicrobiae bacterium]